MGPLEPLVRRLAAACGELLQPSAMALVGSAARGEADEGSDLDLLLIYAEVPTTERLDKVRGRLGGSERLFLVGEPAVGSIVESCYVEGVKCDFAHVARERWETDAAEVLERHAPDSPMQKALSGLLQAVPLTGEPVIQELQAAAVFPEGLREAVVRKHLSFYPLWVAERQAVARDEPLFYQELVNTALKSLLCLLAGLNRVYHWGEIKRLDSFCAQLAVAQECLPQRVRSVLRDPPEEALPELGRLIEEAFVLVEQHLPAVDMPGARSRFRRPYGR